MIYIVHAKKNVVSNIIGDMLSTVSLPENVGIFETDTNVLDFPKPPGDADMVIVPSTHRSKMAKPCLTVHTTGNWTLAEMGGQPKTLPYANNQMIKTLLYNLNKNNTTEWDVTLEADHHGPTYNIPITFIEIGSTEKEWYDKNALDVILNTIIESVKNPLPVPGTGVFGVGGPHYAPKFTRLELTEDDFLIGHILPSYKIDDVDYDTFVQGIEKTTLKTGKVVFDWKGVKSRHKQKILKFCEDYGINWEKR
ncbi:transposase [Candidatus Micrarchaeota archaeon]|nr:transposase [Candidatus Micrarchaeota archaeon]